MTGQLPEQCRYAVFGASTGLAAFQFHGSRAANSLFLMRPATTHSNTSVSQASGSTSFSLAVYAARQTMPNGVAFSGSRGDPGVTGSA